MGEQLLAREIGRLSAVALKKIDTPGLYHDGGGLYLQVTKRGARTWVYRFMLHGLAREMGLGPLHIVGLAEAREKARECRRLRHEGIDPIEARKTRQAERRLAEATAMTFRECAERYIEAHKAGWKNPKHAKQWPSTLETYVYPVFGALPVQAIDVGLVMKVLEPIWKTKPETAGRVRGRIESVLDWATARGYRNGENPARWRGHLDKLLPPRGKVRKVEHHPALPFPDMGEFITALHKQDGIGARALEFLILTATRTGEVIGARWEEFDIGKRVWTVPADRMKASKEHRVPLSDRALAIIEGMKAERINDHPFVFPGARPGRHLSNMAMLKLLGRMGRDDLTAHGFRSTFRDWAAECTSVANQVVEMAMAHTVSDKVEAAYRRGDLFEKRRELMEAWATYCHPETGEENVIRLPGSAGMAAHVARRHGTA
jgi:integrase